MTPRSPRLRVDVPRLLAEIGILAELRRAGDELRGHCPEPTHRRKPGPGSWQIKVVGDAAGLHHCYSCGFGGGPHALVRAVLGLDPRGAYEWLLDFTGGAAPGRVYSASFTRKVAPGRFAQALGFPAESLPLWGEVRDAVRPAVEYLVGRGVTPAEIERARMLAVPPDAPKYAGRVVVPVWVRGELVDFVARLYLDKPATVPKALSGRRDLGARKELALWGYDDLDPTVPVVYVVEGVWGALAARRLGLPNVVAACGSAWSPERTELLAPWDEICLVPDGDRAGSKLVDRAASLRFGHEVTVARLPHGTQPDHEDADLLGAVARREPALFAAAPAVRVAAFEGKLID